MAYLTTTTGNGNAAFAGIAGTFEKIALRLRERRLYRETFDGLSALTNRELADLGLTRSDLRAVARKAARNAAR
ncbi:DUF1127 domain-containing protein [Marimonas sp. MJW-29]|uniref:DUF1127 domain-containing protein n=1 Tax=Sulfitobacter sediminis TaxID=3234186 RepID=A0ABV3RK24_9RHOB